MRLKKVGWLVGASAAYLALSAGVPMLDVRFLHPASAVLISIALFMLIQLVLVVSIARTQMRTHSAVMLAIPAAVLTVGLTYALIKLKIADCALLSLVVAIRSLAMMLLAGALGYLVSFIVREPNLLLPSAVFAAFVDYWSVTWGPLNHMLQNKASVVVAASVQVPAFGQIQPVTMIGIGDFVFLALFFGVLYRFDMNVKGAFWLGYALLTGSMIFVLYYETALPALVPMGVAVIGMNLKHFRLKREELLAVLYSGAILLTGLLVAGFFFLRK